MKNFLLSIHEALISIESEFGGDISFIPPVSDGVLDKFELSIGWKTPQVFRHLYTKESNGIIVDDKKIYSLFDENQKKTWVDNLERMNTAETSPWFVGRPQIFDDYLVIGNDGGIIFCLSKKYHFSNPSLYMCKNPNSKSGVDLDKINLDLEGLIWEMVRQAFRD